ncbi:MAG: indolepyruvate ferredoxin oxidoreductase subunit alpha [Methanosarcinales archaeon]|nr:indolepyruvate ferredoxin oxidoreductase subunit alpha [Methanosarcinales archaeon]
MFSGLDALKSAVFELGIEVLTYVPGYPITGVADALFAECAVNEKVALETALGASATGARAMVLVKHVGMNVLADPLLISASHTIGSAVVVIAGDDLGPQGSQAEMDSRYFGTLSQLPLFDPAGPSSLFQSLAEACSVSEEIKAPAIVRITPRLTGAEEDSIRRPSIPRERHKRFDPAIWNLTARGRAQRFYGQVIPALEERSHNSGLNFLREAGEAGPGLGLGIIASGHPAFLCRDLPASLFVPGYVHPLPWERLCRFAAAHDPVLVAEEPWPFIESQLCGLSGLRGRLTGHLPYGPLEAEDLERALQLLREERVAGPAVQPETAAQRKGRSICDDCPFLSLFRAIGRMEVPVAGDAGCSILAVRQPVQAVDVAYGLGSSIGVASGFRKKGIAVIGDYAFAHSGVQGLMNARWQKKSLLAIVVRNGVAAMTGGQEAIDPEPLLQALAPDLIRLEETAIEDEIVELLASELSRPGLSAIMASGTCPRQGPPS